MKLFAPAAIMAAILFSPPARAEIQVASRSILSIYVFVPEGKKSDVPASSMLRAADRVLREETSLYAISVDELGVDRHALDSCDPAVRFSCWVRAVRAVSPACEYVLVLSVHPETGFYAMLIDAAAAARALELPPEKAEAEIFGALLETKRSKVDLKNEEALEQYFRKLIEVELRPMLERSGHFRAYGSIAVRGVRKGAAIELDGAAVGAAEGEETTISGISAGPHQLRVLELEMMPFEASVQVERGAVAEVRYERRPVPKDSIAPEALSIAGAGLAATGIVLSAVALAHASDGLQSACVVREGAAGGCAALGTPSFGYRPERAPAIGRDEIDGGGVRVAPLGAAFLVAGAVIGGGTWFFTDHTEINWWIVGAGILAGGATYAAGAVLGAR